MSLLTVIAACLVGLLALVVPVQSATTRRPAKRRRAVPFPGLDV